MSHIEAISLSLTISSQVIFRGKCRARKHVRRDAAQTRGNLEIWRENLAVLTVATVCPAPPGPALSAPPARPACKQGGGRGEGAKKQRSNAAGKAVAIPLPPPPADREKKLQKLLYHDATEWGMHAQSAWGVTGRVPDARRMEMRCTRS